MSIFNSNDYKRGYDDGYSAGFDGKDKDFTRSGVSTKFAVYGSKAIDTYNQGYTDGYKKGIEDRHSKIQPQDVKLVVDNDKKRHVSTPTNMGLNYSTINTNF